MRPALLVAGLIVLAAAPRAEAQSCRAVEVDFTPADLVGQEPLDVAPQIAVWLTDAAGTYVDTLFLTEATGRYGLGNRPGRFDFNSGARWPYGRRETVFPVWAHSHPEEFPQLVFQDGHDDNLSHFMKLSSRELHYCAPRDRDNDRVDWDALTCATTPFTDKGMFGSGTSKYPPRSDLTRMTEDTADVLAYAGLNVFDAVSRATPAEGVDARISWMLPAELPDGDYVVWMEVSREFDHNATYSVEAYPAPVGISYGGFGEPYRGQPSVVYRVPITIATGSTVATALDYAGYGDPDGLDGDLRAPDATITSGIAGSGAERLAVRADGGTPYRVRVSARAEVDLGPPAAPSGMAAMAITSRSATIEWVAPGDDGIDGRAAAYDIRYRGGEDITEESFATATPVEGAPAPDEPGFAQSVELDHLLFETEYSVGIRAIDNCGKVGPLTVMRFTTAERQLGEVDACFIATAAYGSVLAPEVAALRQFRDHALKQTVLGQLAIESYYTFGPALAGVIAESDPLRDAVRTLLAPVAARVR